jgi:hypothetical protein
MTCQLAPSWILTTDHAASSHGQPVLVNRASGAAYGPGDLVEAYPSHGPTLAANAVDRLAKTASLDAAGLKLVEKFRRLGQLTTGS